MKLMLGNGKVQKILDIEKNITVTRDYSEILSTTGYKYLPKLIFEEFIDCDEMAAVLEISFDELIKKLNGEETFFIEEAGVIKGKFFSDLSIDYIFEKAIDLERLAHEFDHNVGATMINIATLSDINTEFGRIRDDMDNTDLSNMTAIALRYRDIDHKIRLLTDLIRYTLQDMEQTFEETKIIKDNFFDSIIKTKSQPEAISRE